MSRPYRLWLEDVSGNMALVGSTKAGASGGPRDLKAVDLSTGRETTVVTTPGWDDAGSISGNIVVCQDPRNCTLFSPGGIPGGWPYGNWDIYAHDLATGQEFAVCTDAGDQVNPQIDGDYVVWEDSAGPTNSPNGHGATKIRGVNLRTSERFDVAADSACNSEPSIGNGWVVYTKYTPGTLVGDVMAYEVASGATYKLTAHSGQVTGPRISGNGLVAWNLQVGWPAIQVWGCSVYDRRLIRFASGDKCAGVPAVGKNTVIWQDNAMPGGYQFVGYDLLAGTQFGVASSNSYVHQYQPLDSGGIAWIEDNYERDPGHVKWPGTYTLSIAQPTVIGTFSIADLYQAAVDQSEQSFPDGAETVVLASGQWQDAIASASLTGAHSSLLLTGASSLPAAAAQEIQRLHPQRVILVGGTRSVSASVEARVSSLVASDTIVERIGGATAVDTSLRIASRVASGGLGSRTAVFSPMRGFADGVTVTSLAAAKHIPVVYLAATKFSASDLRRIRSMHLRRAIVMSGAGGMPPAAVKQLQRLLGKKSVVVIAGKNPYEISARFDDYAIKRLGMRLSGVGISTSAGSGDSLMAALKNGRTNSLILFTQRTTLSAPASAMLKTRRRSIRSAVYVGRGKKLISASVRKQIRRILH